MQNLSELHLSKGKQDCDLLFLDMFKSLVNVTSLKYVDLSKLGITKMRKSVLEFLPYLETLILNDNPYLGESGFASNFFARFIPNLKHLHLENVGMENIHIHIFVFRMSGIKLKTLILDRNLISYLSTGIYHGLRTLEVVSITYNQMSSPIDLIAELLELLNLKYLNLSHQNQIIPQHPNRVRRDEDI